MLSWPMLSAELPEARLMLRQPVLALADQSPQQHRRQQLVRVVQQADAAVLRHVVRAALALVHHDEEASHQLLRHLLLLPYALHQHDQRFLQWPLLLENLRRDLVFSTRFAPPQSLGTEQDLLLCLLRLLVGPPQAPDPHQVTVHHPPNMCAGS